MLMRKLNLSDGVIFGAEPMRIADDIVCYSTAISACVKEPNSLMALTLFGKTDQCNMFKDQIVFNPTISACGKGMSWTMMLHLLCQMQNTELRRSVSYYRMAVTTSGKAFHRKIALKLLKEAKEYDGDVSNTIMDNTMFNACEKPDQQSIALKTLVEHGERDNISFNSVSRACAVDKQQEKERERAVFRLMGEKCAEKMHRSNSVLLDAFRRRLAASSVLRHS